MPGTRVRPGRAEQMPGARHSALEPEPCCVKKKVSTLMTSAVLTLT